MSLARILIVIELEKDSNKPLDRSADVPLHPIDALLGLAVAGALAGLCLLLADQYWRPAWDFSWVDHWQGAPILILGPAALLGVVWSQLRWLHRTLSARLIRSKKMAAGLRAWLIGGLAALLSQPIALSTFSGPAVSRTVMGAIGPWLFCGLLAFMIAFITWSMERAQHDADNNKFGRSIYLGTSLLITGVGLLWVDMNLYVGLYQFLHSFLEICAFSSFFSAAQVLGYCLILRHPGALVGSRAVGASLVMVGASYAALPGLRTWVDAQLSHAWVDEFYVGRTLRRMAQLELMIRDGDTLQMERVRYIKQRFEIKDATLDQKYNQFIPSNSSLHLPRQLKKPLNLVVFYVDTLRADVAADEELMPHLARFRRQSWDFRRAYASGSDTLRSLPGILSGTYFLDKTHRGDLLRLAEENRIKTQLVISHSAHEFLGNLLPHFKFQETDVVRDVEDHEQVWGYGAHQPTSAQVVDRGILRINQSKEEPFFLWLFHFDQHGWRELDEAYITQQAEILNVPEHGRLAFRYRVLARSIDEEFGRFIAALDASPRARDTAVLFLSDHGEGLGKGGFWVHSVFLWENLIRVPLVMRVPGEQAHSIDRPVSLVDIAPTMSELWGGEGGIYHGESLKRVKQFAQRRFPLLLRGGEFDHLMRIGMIDERTLDKFVLRLEAGHPELYKLETDPREKSNLAATEPKKVRRIMRLLARSPVFPRRDADFLHANQLEEMSPVSSLRSTTPVETLAGLVETAPQSVDRIELNGTQPTSVITPN